MAKLGTADAFSRYDGLAVGRVMSYLFETQEGIPVDGTNDLLRQLSPFSFRFIPPDELLAAAENSDTEASATLIQNAAKGYSVSGELSRVFPVGEETTTESLEAVVAGATNPNSVPGSFYPALADIYTAADIALQLKTMLEAPPLTLLVNPSQLSISYSKVQAFGTRTRDSSLFEAWGEEQPTLSFSGSTAGFVAGVAASNLTDDLVGAIGNSVTTLGQASGSTPSVSGYQEAARRDSAAWQNFMALYLFYRNNGYIFDTVNRTDANLFIGAIAIDYDQWTYVGHFESFNFGFEEGRPHRVDFEAEFKVDRMYDWASPSQVVLPQSSSIDTEDDISVTPFELLQ